MARLILEKKFLFGGRILSNRGLPKKGVKSTYSNCYVMESPEDSLESIFDCAKKLARTFSYGGGCGIDISRLAPKGAAVNNTAKQTSGAISFMDLYSLVTDLIGQNGRRGALMISMDCSHPDIEEFCTVKSDLSRITKANISVRLSNDFMQAAADGQPYTLHFTRPESGEIIEKEVNAGELLNLIARMNYDYAEPGALFWDRITEWNLLSETKDFQYAGVNPCAEEPLPAGGSCLLGSINLSEFVLYPFTPEAEFNQDSFTDTVRTAVRALNHVLDEGLPFHPLEEQCKSAMDWRQIGLGVFGIGDMLIKLGIHYGSQEARDICAKIGSALIKTALYTSALLAMAYDKFPCCDIESIMKSSFFKKYADAETLDLVQKYGLRNSQLLTIAPTGSLSTMLGVTGGIEPIYDTGYYRKTQSLHEGEKTYRIYTKIVEDYMKLTGKTEKDLPDYFVTAKKIPYIDRLRMQATWQDFIDASISSTVNVPPNFSIEDTENLYVNAWYLGLKGVTIYREGCSREGILSSGNHEVQELKRGEIIKCTDNLNGRKRKLTVGCGTIHCNAWFDEDTGDLLETFLAKGSTGGCPCNENAVSRLISLALRGGIPLEAVIDQLMSCGGCAAYRARTVSLKDTSKGSSCPTAVAYALSDMANIKPAESDAKSKIPLCPECRQQLTFEGGCNICKACGWTKCD